MSIVAKTGRRTQRSTSDIGRYGLAAGAAAGAGASITGAPS